VPPLPLKFPTFSAASTVGVAIDIEGQPVRYIERDGERVWLCDCRSFKERATRHKQGFCAHTAVAIMRCIEDGSIEIR
jgi:hypothetical protein